MFKYKFQVSTISSFTLLLMIQWALTESSFAKTKKLSIDNRSDIQTTFYATPLLVLVSDSAYGMFGIGAGAKYFLDSQSAIDIFFSTSTSGGGQYSSQQLFVRYQSFLGNSFNVSFGGGAQSFRWNQLYSHLGSYDSEFGGYPYTGPNAKYKTQSIGMSASLGNQWQWENFTIGADWLSIYVPTLLVNSRLERFDDEGGSSSKLKDRGERKARRTVAFIPKLNIGVSF